MKTTYIIVDSIQLLSRDLFLTELPSVFQVKAAVMLTLASKLKRDDGLKGSRTSATASDSTRRVSVRDRLLVKGLSSLYSTTMGRLAGSSVGV